MQAHVPIKVGNPQLQQQLQAASITQCGDLLCCSETELMERLNINYSAVKALVREVSLLVAPKPITAAQILKDSQSAGSVRVPTLLPRLDEALRGGLPPGAVTEFVGPSGVGKTQTCMTLALHVAAPQPWGQQLYVVYVDTEGKMGIERLAGMARARYGHNYGLLGQPPGMQQQPGQSIHSTHQQHGTATGMDIEAELPGILDRIKLIKPSNPEELLHAINSISHVARQYKVGLVILDSIAALIRTSETMAGSSKVSMGDRAKLLGAVATQLKSFAESFKVPVMVINQVTAKLSSTSTAHNFQGQLGQHHQQQLQQYQQQEDSNQAALGTAWAHSVNIRIIMERLADRRRMQLVKSPASANVAVDYEIDASGIVPLAHAGMDQGQGQVAAGNVLNASIQNVVEHRMQTPGAEEDYQ